ncbi:hypothetical protein M3Y99_00453500 [Aphelenchoides fujianensis]|nr:hypothetical protein M3Y99_00453500 [Aphelenchoides fujianensis]
MDHLLFFHCQRRKTHLFVDIGEHSKVSDLQKAIRELLGLDEDRKPRIKLPANPERTQWRDTQDEDLFKALDITADKAKAEDPYVLAFCLPEDGDNVELTKLAEPKTHEQIMAMMPQGARDAPAAGADQPGPSS